jgi:hypothetical protein
MALANPIQIVPLHGDALAAPVTQAQLTYRGGPLLDCFDFTQAPLPPPQ